MGGIDDFRGGDMEDVEAAVASRKGPAFGNPESLGEQVAEIHMSLSEQPFAGIDFEACRVIESRAGRDELPAFRETERVEQLESGEDVDVDWRVIAGGSGLGDRRVAIGTV